MIGRTGRPTGLAGHRFDAPTRARARPILARLAGQSHPPPATGGVVTVGDWTAVAEQLADDIREPGFGAAAANASAWSARVDPAATRGLVGAALALTDGDALSALWERRAPCDLKALTSWTEEIEAHTAALLRNCEHLGLAARAERDAALQARTAAVADARTAAAAADIPGRREAAEAAQADAQCRAEEAARVAADCEAALEVLAGADCRLRYARDLLRTVPADVAEVYEAPIALTARGGRMPLSGDFIAPGGPPETITAKGAA
jgi:hypothetical protein